jgi:hypothetical protein
MRKLLILAAVAAVSAACHNRGEDEVGAAPDRGDTTAVTHAIDSTRTGPPGVGGRPGDATVTADSVGLDSVTVQDNTGATDTTLTSAPQDTLGPSEPGAGALDSAGVADTTAVTDTTAQTDSVTNQ